MNETLLLSVTVKFTLCPFSACLQINNWKAEQWNAKTHYVWTISLSGFCSLGFSNISLPVKRELDYHCVSLSCVHKLEPDLLCDLFPTPWMFCFNTDGFGVWCECFVPKRQRIFASEKRIPIISLIKSAVVGDRIWSIWPLLCDTLAKVLWCFGSFNIRHPYPDHPAQVDQASACVPASKSPLLGDRGVFSLWMAFLALSPVMPSGVKLFKGITPWSLCILPLLASTSLTSPVFGGCTLCHHIFPTSVLGTLLCTFDCCCTEYEHDCYSDIFNCEIELSEIQ